MKSNMPLVLIRLLVVPRRDAERLLPAEALRVVARFAVFFVVLADVLLAAFFAFAMMLCSSGCGARADGTRIGIAA
jgi:hypothetical protein